ncbi:hypothetical protein [Niabella drilacis]|uniref:Copper chaperone CopZ n=1 Tax=Niabella drilacis (strain DSM 25811 / CCM 8410 / CCUG 62505 / LMG 26954 / E90) TaxID=1285928 RepID=A0A1G6T664_NIADE|nr:hypothetical protein [Niabella drilacis]SDD24539.1 hypothetical protein SAMN04487894_107110 [Niabella drilacis]
MKLIEVFKTNVLDKAAARELAKSLRRLFPGSKISFDLDDCDRILRIESPAPIDVRQVTFSLKTEGYRADVLH